MPDDILKTLIGEINDTLAVGSEIASDCEITLEANPEDVTRGKIRLWKNLGINRMSLGIQSFNDGLLKKIGRRHSGKEAEESLRMLIEEFKNVSADLIFGLPGQEIDDLREDLKILTEIEPQHISVYSLMYEAGTALSVLKDQGKLIPVDDEASEEMFQTISEHLASAGYEQYETSNYSLPGFRSRHNHGYWTGRPYVGIGPSAHSYDGKSLRKANPADIKGYVNHYAELFEEGKVDEYSVVKEDLTLKERIEERIMLSLRLREGISLESFEKEFGANEKEALLKRAEEGLNNGNLEIIAPSNLRISVKGIMITDSIIIDLI